MTTKYYVDISVRLSVRWLRGWCTAAGRNYNDLRKSLNKILGGLSGNIPEALEYPDNVEITYNTQWWVEIAAEQKWSSEDPMFVQVSVRKYDGASRRLPETHRVRVPSWVKKKQLIEAFEYELNYQLDRIRKEKG